MPAPCRWGRRPRDLTSTRSFEGGELGCNAGEPCTATKDGKGDQACRSYILGARSYRHTTWIAPPHLPGGSPALAEETVSEAAREKCAGMNHRAARPQVSWYDQ